MSRKCLIAAAGVVLMLAISAHGATVTFPAQNVASGVSWAGDYNNVTQDLYLEVGGTATSQSQLSTQLRFDVSSLNGLYGSINSVTIRLRQGVVQSRNPGTAYAYRLTPANANWTTGATWNHKIAASSTDWAGGHTGGTTLGTDYVNTLLGSVNYNPSSPVGTIWDLVIPGAAATTFMNQWTTGGTNEGFLLIAPSTNGDNRGLFAPTGANAPQLIVDYAVLQPEDIPEPATMALLGLAATGLGGYLRRRRTA